MKDLRIFRKDYLTLTDTEIKLHLRFHSFDDDDDTSESEKIIALRNLIKQFQEEGAEFDTDYSLILNPNLVANISDKYPNHWKRLKPTFVQVMSKCCPICSALATRYNGDVDHYRPKSLYSWLAYEFSNYILLCADCNRTYKKAEFPIFSNTKATQDTVDLNDEQPLLINPLVDNPMSFFKVRLFTKGGSKVTNYMRFGLIPLVSDNTSYEHQRALATISIFNLDNSRKDKNGYSDRVDLSRKIYNSLIVLAEKKIDYEKNRTSKNLKRYLNQIKTTKENHGGSWIQFILEGKFEII